jgi:D-alanine--poly(phosphoribitol) ligase subunit 1
MTINVLEYLDRSVGLFASKTAFADENNSITYENLTICAQRIGTFLFDQTGGQRRRPIVVFVDRNIETIVSFLGVAFSGNFYVPIDTQMPISRVQLIIKTLQPLAALVLDSELEYARRISSNMLIIKYEEALSYSIDNEKMNEVRRRIIDTDPLYATFTSGSTGIPKGVITCQRSVIDMTEALADTFRFDHDCIFGNQNPFYFDASIKDIYSSLKSGATMHIIPKRCFTFPTNLVEFLNLNKINTILWSAAAISLIANTKTFEESKPDYLKTVMFSGEVMHNKILNYWRSALKDTMFVNLYGPTEITSVCTYFIVDQQYADEDILPIGIPFKNTEILILKEMNQPVQLDEIGEICVRGCCLALGYYNNPEKTNEAFCQNPLNKYYPEVIYRTGDLAKYNKDRQIIFLSRKDNQVKHMGQRVELGEIEILINSLALIEASICFYDHEKQKIVLVYKGKNADKKYIINEIKDIVPKYMYPNIIVGVEELPLNVNGKIDRTMLKHKYELSEI